MIIFYNIFIVIKAICQRYRCDEIYYKNNTAIQNTDSAV